MRRARGKQARSAAGTHLSVPSSVAPPSWIRALHLSSSSRSKPCRFLPREYTTLQSPATLATWLVVTQPLLRPTSSASRRPLAQGSASRSSKVPACGGGGGGGGLPSSAVAALASPPSRRSSSSSGGAAHRAAAAAAAAAARRAQAGARAALRCAAQGRRPGRAGRAPTWFQAEAPIALLLRSSSCSLWASSLLRACTAGGGRRVAGGGGRRRWCASSPRANGKGRPGRQQLDLALVTPRPDARPPQPARGGVAEHSVAQLTLATGRGAGAFSVLAAQYE
jgi:hypothetical protein